MKIDPRTKHRLLEPGWAGELTDEELAYIASQLAVDEKLRYRWGFRKRKNYPLDIIRQKAFPERKGEAPRFYKRPPPANAFPKGHTLGIEYRFKPRMPFAEAEGPRWGASADVKN